jgi:predicted TIM-barrel fold metal-dependent hydrolase
MTTDKRPPTDMLIVDAHCHLGFFRNFHIPRNDVSGLLDEMDRLGIDVAALAHHAGISSDFRLGNDEVAAAIAAHPDRFVGYCVINPNFPDEVQAELERCFSIPGFRGVKVHPELHGDYPLDGPHYRPAWEFVNRHRLPLLSHSYFGGDSLAVFDRLAAEYPDATVLLGHAGLDLGLPDAIALVKRHPNVLLDLTGPLMWDRMAPVLLEHLPADRLVYGSDIPFVSGALQLGGLVCADVPRADLEQIAGLNACRMFGIVAGERSAAVLR